MIELTTRSMNAIGMMVQGANDQVFAGTGLGRITFRILVGFVRLFFVGWYMRLRVFLSLATVAWV